jgi:hypothetical protein
MNNLEISRTLPNGNVFLKLNGFETVEIINLHKNITATDIAVKIILLWNKKN